MKQKFDFRFNDENIQRKFTNLMETLLSPFPDLVIADPIYKQTALGVLNGKIGDTLKLNKRMYDNNVSFLQRYISGEEKKDFFNFNSFTTFHEMQIYKQIGEESGGNLSKLIHLIEANIKQLETENFQYNVVYYQKLNGYRW